MEKLTKGQKEALEAVRTGRNVCITGGGGVGKSYISRKIIEDLQKQRKTVLITASTGRAAMLIGGITCHRAFNIPVKLTWQAEPKITASSPIYEADAVIIDEVSMLRIDAFEFIARVVKDVNEIRKSPEYRKDPKNRHRDPVQMIVVGDFGQLPPVIVHPNDGSPDEGDLMSEYYGFDVGSGYAFQASGWKQSDFLLCDLQEVVRQSDQAMVDALQRIRFGDYTAIEYFSKNARKKPFSSEEGVVYLCGKNRTAERINDVRVSKLSGKERTYEAEITGQVTEQDKQAPELLRLKKNAQVVMLLNTEKYRNGSTLLGEDLTLPENAEGPQILIYHTHSQETFADSRPGERADTVIGLGDDLQELLEKQYGYEVLHITEAFDMKEGCLERSRAYNYAEPVIAAALEEHPSIQVVIDLHRDGVNGSKRLVTEINGKPTAQIMFFNGLSRTKESGELTSLPNPYQAENLAFSFQMEYEAEQYYPGFSRCIYLKGYRYNLHLRPRSVLLEVGAQTNTVEEVKNAMGPFSDILHKVLSGKSPASGG